MPRASALNLTRWLHLAVLVAGLAYAAFAHAEVRLDQLRLSAGDETTRAELHLDGVPGEYKVFSLANPDRLVLDLPAASVAEGFRAPAPNGRVIGVRTGTPEPGKLRIVFDLAGAVKPRTRVEGTGRESRGLTQTRRSSPCSDCDGAVNVRPPSVDTLNVFTM